MVKVTGEPGTGERGAAVGQSWGQGLKKWEAGSGFTTKTGDFSRDRDGATSQLGTTGRVGKGTREVGSEPAEFP